MKKVIRLTENDLHRIVKESVDRILKEASWSNAYTDPDDSTDCDEYEEELADKWKRKREDEL